MDGSDKNQRTKGKKGPTQASICGEGEENKGKRRRHMHAWHRRYSSADAGAAGDI
jgi:hypothetical protein